MDTQEKEKKSEEIAAQTNQTKERPVPAQPSDAESKKEKAKVEAELNKGFPGNRSVGNSSGAISSAAPSFGRWYSTALVWPLLTAKIQTLTRQVWRF